MGMVPINIFLIGLVISISSFIFEVISVPIFTIYSPIVNKNNYISKENNLLLNTADHFIQIFTKNLCTSSRRVVGPSWNNGGRSGFSVSSGFSMYQFSIPGSPCCMRWVAMAAHCFWSAHFNTDSRDCSTADPHSALIVSGVEENLYLYLCISVVPSSSHGMLRTKRLFAMLY